MMRRAQQQQVREIRFAAVGPVIDVMQFGVAFVMTTWERTGAVAGVHGASERRCRDALFAADVQRLAIGAIDDRHDRAVTAMT